MGNTRSKTESSFYIHDIATMLPGPRCLAAPWLKQNLTKLLFLRWNGLVPYWLLFTDFKSAFSLLQTSSHKQIFRSVINQIPADCTARPLLRWSSCRSTHKHPSSVRQISGTAKALFKETMFLLELIESLDWVNLPWRLVHFQWVFVQCAIGHTQDGRSFSSCVSVAFFSWSIQVCILQGLYEQFANELNYFYFECPEFKVSRGRRVFARV